MKHHLTAQKLVLTLALLACSICIFSFRQNDTTEQKTFRKESATNTDDTTTRRKRNRDNYEYRINDLDNAMRHLDEQMLKLDEQMKKMDFSKMQKELNQAAKIDHEKIARDVEASLAKVDWKKVQAEMEASMAKMKDVDMVKMQEDMKKMKSEMQASMEKMKAVDMVKIKEDMKNMKAELSKQKIAQIDGEKIRKDVARAMENAKVSIEKAKDEIKQLQEFTTELEKDGLIDKKKDYKIEVKDGELYINGKKQSKEVSDKYRKYYRKNNFSINNAGGVSI